ncbi:two-component regulator propeller domain-containing protein [Methylibium rhizosphaerae]|uniref:sensor histidine kinase n=1 Tax=Methylibium rhizosphaerae TaxID=2570323 RepID=UPI0011281264|nr:two-component regulator propeller domain-containing protein [Methylibium rhizosphaerae]
MGWWTDRCAGLGVALALAGAAAVAHAQQVVVDSFQQEQGLANLTAQCIEQDVRGALWVCTANGLFTFDGFRIRQELLPEAAGMWISVVRADSAGRVWVATGDGLFVGRSAGAGYRWDEVRSEAGGALILSSGQRLDLDAAGAAYAMDDDGVVWTIRPPQRDTDRVVAQRVPLPAYDPWPGSHDAKGAPLRVFDGALWFGCGKALCEWSDGRLHRWGEESGVPPRAWASFVRGRDGTLWARSPDLLLSLSPGTRHFESIAAPPARRWSGTVAMVQDAAGRIVTATDEGLASWDGRKWRQWTPRRNGLPETAVRALLVDAEGSVWLGTSGRGLHRWVGWGGVEHWTTADGLPSPVAWGSARDRRGRLWVATSQGLARFDAQAGRFELVHGAGGQWVGGLQADAAGNIWWREGDSVLVALEGERIVRAAFAEPDSEVDLARGGKGEIYALGNRRVHRMVAAGAAARAEPLATNPPDGRFWSVAHDGSRDWFVSSKRLLCREGSGWRPLLDEQGRPVGAHVYATFSGSRLWTVDSQGVSAYEVKDDGVARPVRRFSKEQLGGVSPMFLRADAGGRIWLGSDRGVLVHEGGRWARLDRSNGLLWNDASDFALRFDADGTAWIGTSAGLTQLLPGWQAPNPPRLRLERLEFGSRSFREPPLEAIDWSDRNLRATVATADFASGRSMRIEYRLGGGDAPWREVVGGVLQVDSLQPGWHLLEMRAAGSLGAEQAGPALQVSFEVDPPWWLSVPAKLGYAAGLAALWALSTWLTSRRARARRIELERAVAERTAALDASQQALRQLGEHNARALEEERKHVSRELHDEMGQQLAALRMEVSVLGMQVRNQKPPHAEQFDMLLDRVDRLVRSVRGLVSQLRPPALDGGLAAALDWLAEEFRRNTGIACRLEIDPAACELRPEQATMVFRIAQESLTNVRRHADASQVTLRLQRGPEGVVLSVRDNGVGFDAAVRNPGHGLLGMQERARLLRGELSVASSPGAGTTVSLRVDPLH